MIYNKIINNKKKADQTQKKNHTPKKKKQIKKMAKDLTRYHAFSPQNQSLSR